MRQLRLSAEYASFRWHKPSVGVDVCPALKQLEMEKHSGHAESGRQLRLYSARGVANIMATLSSFTSESFSATLSIRVPAHAYIALFVCFFIALFVCRRIRVIVATAWGEVVIHAFF